MSQVQSVTVGRPRLNKMIIKNFGCIGSYPVEIELDDIVVLVGPNNVGKSTILRAYEVIMSEGSKEANLTLDDFPNGEVKQDALPEIELHTVVYDNSPGERWIRVDETTGEKYVREKWTWSNPGAPKRQGFDVNVGDWANEVPWGAANVANSRRPQPHRVEAFSDPQKQAQDIIKILNTLLEERVKELKTITNDQDENEKTDYEILLDKIEQIQKKIVEESMSEINKVEQEVSEIVNQVFPGYKIKFDARPEEDIDKTINLFKANSKLLMGPENGFQSSIERQGSGARRTLIWAALRYISESAGLKTKKDAQNKRPHVLLLDEPELCLHPNAIREACKVLYDLPQSSNWQVMVTTHSPSFIDLSRNNTTIVRVSRNKEGRIDGTTLFRPSRVKLDDDDRQNLKLLNIFDPYVAEFFFGGRSIIVEGDTEYTAFKHVIASKPEEFKDVHIIRARGKATVASLVKVLNHFGSKYSVLHDSDTPLTKNQKGNPAWGNNHRILNAVNSHPDRSKVRLLASIPNLEEAFFGQEAKGEKPYNALLKIRDDSTKFQKIEDLLRALTDHSCTVPEGSVEWSEIENLEAALNEKSLI
jgi:putative ATP-dependent endonuclease of the OLD family